ncbi:DUF6355 family natural product biosynthesis protein [Nonomuraea sp. NPDC026600]|uniref:DUF6355 family natural product biosynthesis protein n=1 Tax=Nonomuraea sp. NPDC026600 TaxID=3155363 RepID=UPI0033FB17E4
MKRLTSHVRRAAAGIAIAGTLTALPVALPLAQAHADGCGFKVEGVRTVYYHCDSRTNVWIHINFTTQTNEPDLCVPPGRTDIGHVFIVKNAWYAGQTCDKPGDIRWP